MAEKNRIRNLSTRWLLPFKVVVFAIYIALCLAIVFSYARHWNSFFDLTLGLINAGFFVYFFFRLMRMTSKLYRIEFDNDFLYVLLKNQDIVIPLENIESVEISTIGGVYRVNLYHPEQLGEHFYFKMSLFYPLNYQSKDALVDVLRKNIDRASQRRGSSLKMHCVADYLLYVRGGSPFRELEGSEARVIDCLFYLRAPLSLKGPTLSITFQ